MKVVFDAYWWVHGPAAVRRVLREIVLTWNRLHPEDELTLVVRKKHRADVDAPAGVRIVESGIYPQGFLARYATARVAKATGADAIFVHNFAAKSSAVSAVYLHDVLFETNPEWFTRPERAYFSLMTRWAPSADVVFSSTRAEGDRIARHTRAKHVLPIGLGLSRELMDSDDIQAVPDLVAGEFLLTVGRLNARKNLAGAIAGALASGRLRPDFPLVVAGGADGRAGDMGADVQAAIADGRIRLLGHVSDAQLRWLYRESAAFVYVSLGEGYGMPPVEAVGFGATPIVSDLPVFRETLGEVATYVDPMDPAAIGAAIRTALDTSSDLTGPRQIGTTWEQTVEAIRAEVARLVAARK